MTYYFLGGGTRTFGTGSMTSSFFGGNITIQPVVELPVQRGEGPPGWSTCTDLARSPYFIWDLNHYYRALGFTWPFQGISRRDLRLAYQRLAGHMQDGQGVAFLTYAMDRLLDETFRRCYDRLPFGARALDQYVRLEIKQRAHEEALRARECGRDVRAEDVLRMWGFDTTEPNEPVVDAEEPLGDDAQNPSALSDPLDTVPEPWPWGYYVWRSSCGDGDRLARWQELLLAVARARRLRARFAIGFVGRTPKEWVVAQHQSCVVIFLHEDVEPTGVLAALAVDEATRVIEQQ